MGMDSLTIIDGGVDSDVSGLFLRSSPEFQEVLLQAASMIAEFLPNDETFGQNEVARTRPTAKLTDGLSKLLGEDKVDTHVSAFIYELLGLSQQTVFSVAEELREISIGNLRLSETERQMMSNLSDGGLLSYLAVLGIGLDDIGEFVLDIGTGRGAYFAEDLLLLHPERKVVSTSVHLGGKKSNMRKGLSGAEGVGALIAANGKELAFRDHSFDTIVSVNADPYYTRLDDLEDGLREKHRVMNVGSTALLCPAVCDYGRHNIQLADIEGLAIDVELVSIPDRALGLYYDKGIEEMLVIKK